MKTTKKIKQRLEYLRGELRKERISWGELHELQCLAGHIDSSDNELLEAAGVPEHHTCCAHCGSMIPNNLNDPRKFHQRTCPMFRVKPKDVTVTLSCDEISLIVQALGEDTLSRVAENRRCLSDKSLTKSNLSAIKKNKALCQKLEEV